jgi:hypothetical protein
MEPENTTERRPHYRTAAALLLGLILVAAASMWMHVRLLKDAHQEAGWPDGGTQGRLVP